jgi:hypothetical protein
MFSVQDFFVVGLGCDLVGAVLLAKGLLLSPRDMVGLGGTYWGYNAKHLVSLADDKRDALFGVGALVAGFALQIVGYLAELGWRPRDESGADAALAALGLTVGAMLVWTVAYVSLRSRLAKRMHVQLALAWGEGEGWTNERAALLIDLGNAAGYEPLEGELETKPPHVRRVYGIDLPEHLPGEKEAAR